MCYVAVEPDPESVGAKPDRGAPRDDLVAVVQRLSMARSLHEIQTIVRSASRRLTGADGATFVLRAGDDCHYVDEDAIAPLWKGQRFAMKACVSGWVMRNRRAVAIGDIYNDQRVPHDAYRATFVKSLAMVPIRQLDPLGAIGTYWATSHLPSERELAALQALADSTAVAIENVYAYEELDAARVESLRRLALAAEYRDDGSHQHTARVARTAGAIARTLGMPDAETSLIELAAPLHDVGKLAIPDATLLKRGRLTDAEFEQVKSHTTVGASILAGSGVGATALRRADRDRAP